MLESSRVPRHAPLPCSDTAAGPGSRRDLPPAPTAPRGGPGGLDDATLAARAVEADLAALGELLGRYQGPMYRLALRVLGDPGDAEDAVQEAFVSAWRRLGTFRGDAAFSTWLYRIVANRCLNVARTRSRRPAEATASETLDTVRSVGTAPDDLAVAADLQARIQAALAGLPATQRVCWVLRESDGLGYDEIAGIVGLSPDAVRGRIHRARRTLTAAMDGWR
jgi:RNA polymerase sigma-70 factor (ECF subfamily)